MKYDFVAIGDSAVDTFIELDNANINCVSSGCDLSIKWGEKIPFKNAVKVYSVGNAANASVCARRLGLNSALVTDFGEDDEGKLCVDKLKVEKVDTSYIRLHEGKPTNQHYALSYKAERTILVKHVEYKHVFPHFDQPPKMMYLSSLGEHALSYHKEITDYVSLNKDVMLVFQPGTFQISAGYKKLSHVYEASHLFFCNVEEAISIVGDGDIVYLLKELRNRGPKNVIITDGPKGAYVYTGEDIYFISIYKDIAPPKERTGAGDSFASTFSSLYLESGNIEYALLRAPINSMNVVQYIGAQEGLLTKDELEKFYINRAKDYVIEKINL